MIFSLKKLKQLANLDKSITLEDVTKAINSIGFELESATKLNNIQGIKFGHIIELYKNPNADNLTVCQIQFADKQRTIQTRATNLKQDDYVMAFVPGASSGEVIFAAKELKGIISEGMLVSLNELGFDSSLVSKEVADGIFSFKKVDLNLDPLDYFDLDDYLLDIKILANRADANSYLIMAKELAAYFRINSQTIVIKNKPSFKSSFVFEDFLDNKLTGFEAKMDEDFELSIQDQLLLLKSSIKLVNPVVDLSNLTLIMTGQPVHVYDVDKLNSQKLVPAIKSQVKETVLGNKEVEISNALVICNENEEVLAFPAVIGLEKNAVDKNSKNILFEIGIFDTQQTRKTTKELKINNLTSNRAIKNFALGSLDLAHKFLKSYLNNFSFPINLATISKKEITFDLHKMKHIAGIEFYKDADFKNVLVSLKSLGFEFDFPNKKVKIPTYRYDIELNEDMLEEFLRFFGYTKLEPTLPKNSVFKIQAFDVLKEQIRALGFTEVKTYTLVSQLKNEFNPFNFTEQINLSTFLSKERETIRNTQAISISEIVEYNLKRKIEAVSFFEVGMINSEINSLVLASTEFNFYQLKQKLLNLFSLDFEFVRTDSEQFHNGVSAKIYYNNDLLGWIGKPHPKLKLANAFYLEINLDKLQEFLVKNNKFQAYNINELKTRDITFTLDKKESIKDNIAKLKQIPGIFSISLKDSIYINEKHKITLHLVCDEKSIEFINKIYENLI